MTVRIVTELVKLYAQEKALPGEIASVSVRDKMPAAISPEVRVRLKKAITDELVPRIARGEPEKRMQSKVARAMGVSPGAINRLLKHDQGGSLAMVVAVARLLGVPPGAILFGESKAGGGGGSSGTVRLLKDTPGFAEALEDAIQRTRLENPGLSEESLRRTATFGAVPPLERVTAAILIALAAAEPHRR